MKTNFVSLFARSFVRWLAGFAGLWVACVRAYLDLIIYFIHKFMCYMQWRFWSDYVTGECRRKLRTDLAHTRVRHRRRHLRRRREEIDRERKTHSIRCVAEWRRHRRRRRTVIFCAWLTCAQLHVWHFRFVYSLLLCDANDATAFCTTVRCVLHKIRIFPFGHVIRKCNSSVKSNTHARNGELGMLGVCGDQQVNDVTEKYSCIVHFLSSVHSMIDLEKKNENWKNDDRDRFIADN